MKFAVDIETVGKDGKEVLHYRKGNIIVIGVYNGKEVQQYSVSDTAVKDILENSANELIFWNATFDLTWLIYTGLKVQAKIYDAMLLYQLLFNCWGLDISLTAVSQRFLGTSYIGQDWIEKNKYDVKFTYEIWQILQRELEKQPNSNQLSKYYNLLREIIWVIVDMQLRGIEIDVKYLDSLLLQYSNEVENRRLKITLETGIENINSVQQLNKYLFGKLGIKPLGSKGKSGQYSVSTSVLLKLAEKYPVCQEIVEYRALSKLFSMCKEYKSQLIGSRIYPMFHLGGTVSGRLSSSEPNVQNIPPELRGIIIAASGCKLVKADLSQIELRVAAELSQDGNMIQAFCNGADFHQAVADKLKIDRKRAKAINFGVLYGMSVYTLARDLHISEEEAEKMLNSFFDQYVKLRQFIDRCRQQVQERKVSYTMLGRPRYFEMVDDKALREGFNHVIQGTAADWMLVIMRNLYRRGVKYIINQVHDELVFEIPEDRLKECLSIIRSSMTSFITKPQLQVPIEVKIEVLDRWK